MSVRKRKTKSGQSEEYHYEFMQHGKRYYGVCEGCTNERDALSYEKSIRKTTKKLSEQKNINALVENFKMELTGAEIILISDAYEIYHEKPKPRTPSKNRERTNHAQWGDFVSYMKAKFPDIEKISDVTRIHAEGYISEIRNHGRFIKEVVFKAGKGRKRKNAKYNLSGLMSPNTINAYHKQCKSVFEHLKADAGLLNNPFDFPLMKCKSDSREAFTPEELRLIGEKLNYFVKPIFVIGICTGLSEGDICCLRWEEIRDGWITRKRRKTGAGLDIPILPPLAKFLAKQKEVSGDDDYVIPEHAAMYKKNPSGVSYRVKSFLEDLKIKTTKKVKGRGRAVSVKDVHSLRHTFAYIAGCYQIPLPIVQSVLGHMSPEMTKHYQAHADREAKEKYLSQMPNFLEPPDNTPITIAVESERQKLIDYAHSLPLEIIHEILIKIEDELND